MRRSRDHTARRSRATRAVAWVSRLVFKNDKHLCKSLHKLFLLQKNKK